MTLLFGIESEQAISSLDLSDEFSPSNLCRRLMKESRGSLTHLDHTRQGIFIANGARFYIDHGNHPEWCTAECTNPTDVVNQVRAGERMLSRSIKRSPDVSLYRCNIDYVTGATWGCHESHLHRHDPKEFPRLLIPHLVSRIIYTGAGGLNPYHLGVAFSLSPRSMHFREISSPSRVISIYDTREESLACEGYHRCHMILGETLCADRPLWLRLATTAILVALADEGLLQTKDVPSLDLPIRALHTFAGDPTLTATAKAKGESITALNIQYGYLRIAERHLRHRVMPDWAFEACREWRIMLDRLKQGPGAVARTCDWAIKYAIFTDWLAEQGYGWERIGRLNALLEELQHKARLLHCESPDQFDAAPAEHEWCIEKIMSYLNPAISLIPTDKEELTRFLHLRHQLCDIDLQYGCLPNGLFSSIESELDHAVPGVNTQSITRAETIPPADTRAAARGRAIGRLHSNHKRYNVDWMLVRDREQNRVLDLSDPFTTRPRWKKVNIPPKRSHPDIRGMVSQAYHEGDFNKVRELLDMLRVGWDGCPNESIPYLPYYAWIQSRTGQTELAEATLDRLSELDSSRDMITDYLSIYRFQGLTPQDGREWNWIRRGNETADSSWDGCNRVSFLGHEGYVLSRVGRWEEAMEVLRESVSIPIHSPNHQRIVARNRCDLADCLRLVGRCEEAERELDQADRFLRRNGFRGERAAHALLTKAKLILDPEEAMATLDFARRILQELGHTTSLIRAKLLEARLCNSPEEAEHYRQEIVQAQQRIPDLRHCPRLGEILESWDEWICRGECKKWGDYFWRL